MEQRQAVEFLRRRYASAILGNDADTACRLRAQLNGIMNRRADPLGQALPLQAARPEALPPEILALEAALDALPVRARCEPRLQLVTPVTPVTGLLDTRRPLPRAAQAG
jgi:hypothetical protein